MRKPLGQIKIVVLKRNRKEHLAECDESGAPKTVTLCKKQYEAASRTANRPYHAPDSKTCEICVLQHDIRKSVSLRGRASDPADLETHFRVNWKAACGQDCAGDLTDRFDRVTCQKCRAWLRKQENSI